MSPKKNKKKVVLGIDIGGTKIAGALVSNGKIVSKVEKVKTPHGSKILSEVEKIYNNFSRSHIISGIGISTAGMVSDSGRIAGSSGNIPGWEGTKVREVLSKKFHVPVAVENDANAAAFAAYHFGESKDANPMVLVILGTGVGGGIVVNGRLVRGAHFAGGEIGHYQLSYGRERLCTCGKHDCFEAYASGNGLLALIKEYFPKSYKNISTRKLFELTKSKNTEEKMLATKAIEEWHYYVALGTSVLIHTFDPKKVVYSGGLAEQLNIKYLISQTERVVLPALKKSVKDTLMKTPLKNDAGLIGAALLVSQHIEIV